LAPTRFKLVFDLTRRFDEVLDLLRFFAFFMILPIWIQLSSDWASIRLLASRRDCLPLYGCQNGFVDRQRLQPQEGEKIPAQEELKQANRQVLWLGL
jgi:hypothetical protein